MRESINKKTQLEVFNRDKWHCRYCCDAVIYSPVLKVFESISPGHGYYHPHGKTGKMLRYFANKFASVDHIIAVTKGGSNEIDNYVTSCWECNLKFGNKSHSEGKPNPKDIIDVKLNWDGMLSLYDKLK